MTKTSNKSNTGWTKEAQYSVMTSDSDHLQANPLYSDNNYKWEKTEVGPLSKLFKWQAQNSYDSFSLFQVHSTFSKDSIIVFVLWPYCFSWSQIVWKYNLDHSLLI